MSLHPIYNYLLTFTFTLEGILLVTASAQGMCGMGGGEIHQLWKPLAASSCIGLENMDKELAAQW